MGCKAPTPAPEKQNGRPPVPPPPPPYRGNETSYNVLKAEQAIAKLMTVIEPGTKVWLGPKGEIEGTVVEVAIKSGPQYRVTWWSGNDRKSEWLEECELLTAPQKMTVQLGFRE